MRRALNEFKKPFLPCFPLAISNQITTETREVLSWIAGSGSEVAILNAPSPREIKGQLPCSGCLKEYPITQEAFDLFSRDFFIINNINKSTDSDEALEQIAYVAERDPSAHIKLEILDKNRVPSDDMILKVVQEASSRWPGLSMMPFLSPNPETVQRAIELRSKAVRILAGQIGELSGVANDDELNTICRDSSLPVVLEGGIGSAEDVRRCFELGADYVLATSVLQDNPEASLIAQHFNDVAEKVLAQRIKFPLTLP